MTKTKSAQKSRFYDVEEPSPAGGEALRRRVVELWEFWDEDLRVRLETPAEGEVEAPFRNLDLLQIISERNFPDGRQLGEESWAAYQSARKLEASLKREIEALRETIDGQQTTKNLSDYGAARELAGYRAAQLEMLVADHVANWRISAEGNATKYIKADQRLQLLVAYLKTNSLTLLLPGTIAADADHREKINSRYRLASFGPVAEKQLERQLVSAFGVLRAEAMIPYIENLKKADRVTAVLVDKHKHKLGKQLRTQGISIPSTERQFKEAIERALKTFLLRDTI